jgi:ectoine hydroxylase-related dioxygenase (phytanoyl-CoA dioxygenase family)
MLTSEQCRSFWAAGFLPVGRVSGPWEVASLKDEASRLIRTGDGLGPEAPEDHLMRSAALGGEEAGRRHVRVALHLCHISNVFRAHAVESHVAAMVRALFDEEPVVLTSLLFNKPPEIGEALALHQDLPYYPYLRDDDLVTCWMALDDAGEANGCLEYLPGSHRARIPHRHTGAQQALDIDPADIDVEKLVRVPLMAGEAVLHHGLTVHRSGPNRSGLPRMGLATLYVRERANVSVDDFAYLVLVPAPAGSR